MECSQHILFCQVRKRRTRSSSLDDVESIVFFWRMSWHKSSVAIAPGMNSFDAKYLQASISFICHEGWAYPNFRCVRFKNTMSDKWVKDAVMETENLAAQTDPCYEYTSRVNPHGAFTVQLKPKQDDFHFKSQPDNYCHKPPSWLLLGSWVLESWNTVDFWTYEIITV